MRKVFLLFITVCLVHTGFAQVKVTSNGKASVGKVHTLDNGRLKIGNDGTAEGLSFNDSSNGGTDFRIFRSGNIAYLTRGTNLTRSIKMHSSGAVTIGGSTKGTGYGGALRVYSDGEDLLRVSDIILLTMEVLLQVLVIGLFLWFLTVFLSTAKARGYITFKYLRMEIFTMQALIPSPILYLKEILQRYLMPSTEYWI